MGERKPTGYLSVPGVCPDYQDVHSILHLCLLQIDGAMRAVP